MNTPLYFEDFHAHQTFEEGGYVITKEAAVAFAKEFDPQYFHVDEEAAKQSFFKALAVSGWHTAAASMHLKIKSPLGRVKNGLIGMGLEKLRWPRSVYPGDTLRIVITILAARPSQSRPELGVVRYEVKTFNQHDVLVMEGETAVLIPRRAT